MQHAEKQLLILVKINVDKVFTFSLFCDKIKIVYRFAAFCLLNIKVIKLLSQKGTL